MSDSEKIRIIAELLAREYALGNLSYNIDENILNDLKSMANRVKYYEAMDKIATTQVW